MTTRNTLGGARSAAWLVAALLGTSGPAFASQALANKHACMACHAVASKLVGPSYQEVAAKYGGDKSAVTALAQSIRGGGSGKWGDMAMPPQPNLSEADAKRLATWILGGAR